MIEKIKGDPGKNQRRRKYEIRKGKGIALNDRHAGIDRNMCFNSAQWNVLKYEYINFFFQWHRCVVLSWIHWHRFPRRLEIETFFFLAKF